LTWWQPLTTTCPSHKAHQLAFGIL